jgi:hypothetical protein
VCYGVEDQVKNVMLRDRNNVILLINVLQHDAKIYGAYLAVT